MSVVITVFNQEHVIVKVLEDLQKSLELDYEIIVIDDASSDNSLKNVISWAEKQLCPVRVIRNFFPKYETACDDDGIQLANGEIVILVQSDIFVSDDGFDKRFSVFFETYDDLFLISGRGTDTWSSACKDLRSSLGSTLSFYDNFQAMLVSVGRRIARNSLKRIRRNLNRTAKVPEHFDSPDLEEIFPTIETFRSNGYAGMRGEFFYTDDNKSFVNKNNLVWLSESVMRGPLAIRKDRYLLLNGFDRRRFFLGFDDHDLSLRAWVEYRWRTGYCYVNAFSAPDLGTTRKNRSIRQEIELILFTFLKKRPVRKSALYKFESRFDFIPPMREIRSVAT